MQLLVTFLNQNDGQVRLCSQCKEKTPTGSHRSPASARKTPSFPPLLLRLTQSWRELPVLTAIDSCFVTNLAGKPFDDCVPDVRTRHQVAHTAAENMSYTPNLAKASSSESSKLKFCHKLSRKTFWRLRSRCMEKTPTGSHHGGKHVAYTHPGEGCQF